MERISVTQLSLTHFLKSNKITGAGQAGLNINGDLILQVAWQATEILMMSKHEKVVSNKFELKKLKKKH